MIEDAVHRYVSGSQGAGTDEKVLIEVLASRTASEVQNIKAAYKQGKGSNGVWMDIASVKQQGVSPEVSILSFHILISDCPKNAKRFSSLEGIRRGLKLLF